MLFPCRVQNAWADYLLQPGTGGFARLLDVRGATTFPAAHLQSARVLQAAASVGRSKPIFSSARPDPPQPRSQRHPIILFRLVLAINMSHRQSGTPNHQKSTLDTCVDSET